MPGSTSFESSCSSYQIIISPKMLKKLGEMFGEDSSEEEED